MKEHPILFNGEMVRAILEGRKTQTRRVIKPQPTIIAKDAYFTRGLDVPRNKSGLDSGCDIKCPYGVPGDKLWARETFVIETNVGLGSDCKPPFDDGRPLNWVNNFEGDDSWEQCHYRATDPAPELAYDDYDDTQCRWRPSIHMPRWASRINLKITDIRVERVQDISDEDVIAEGIETSPEYRDGVPFVDLRYVIKDFHKLWDSINEKRGYGWDKNPFVWVVEFKITKDISE